MDTLYPLLGENAVAKGRVKKRRQVFIMVGRILFVVTPMFVRSFTRHQAGGAPTISFSGSKIIKFSEKAGAFGGSHSLFACSSGSVFYSCNRLKTRQIDTVKLLLVFFLPVILTF